MVISNRGAGMRGWIPAMAVLMSGCAPRPGAVTVSLAGWGAPASPEMRVLPDGSIAIRPGPPFVELAPPIGGAKLFLLAPPSLVVREADASEWERGVAPPHRCDAAPRAAADFEIGEDGTLLVAGRRADGSGEARRVVPDPGGRRLGVLTVRGVAVPSWSPAPWIGSAPRVLGWRQLRVFSRRDGRALAAPVALGFGGLDLQLCWTPEGSTLLYFDDLFRKVTLVRVDPSGGER